jgi:hypothetical protein
VNVSYIVDVSNPLLNESQKHASIAQSSRDLDEVTLRFTEPNEPPNDERVPVFNDARAWVRTGRD